MCVFVHYITIASGEDQKHQASLRGAFVSIRRPRPIPELCVLFGFENLNRTVSLACNVPIQVAHFAPWRSWPPVCTVPQSYSLCTRTARGARVDCRRCLLGVRWTSVASPRCSPLCRTDALRAVAQRLHAKRRFSACANLIYRHELWLCSAVLGFSAVWSLCSSIANRCPAAVAHNNMLAR